MNIPMTPPPMPPREPDPEPEIREPDPEMPEVPDPDFWNERPGRSRTDGEVRLDVEVHSQKREHPGRGVQAIGPLREPVPLVVVDQQFGGDSSRQQRRV